MLHLLTYSGTYIFSLAGSGGEMVKKISRKAWLD